MERFLLLLLFFSSQAFCVEESSPRDRIAEFLQSHVIGKTQVIETKGNATIGKTSYEVEFKAKVTLSRLTPTEKGLRFVETLVIEQTNHELDAEGKRTGSAVQADRTVKHLYLLGERISTGNLAGVAVVTKNTQTDPTGEAYSIIVELTQDGKQLDIYDSSAVYRDGIQEDGTAYPVSSASVTTYSLGDKGKLQRTQTLKFYSVDVEKDYAKTETGRFTIDAVEE